jgi:hypothetical protein
MAIPSCIHLLMLIRKRMAIPSCFHSAHHNPDTLAEQQDGMGSRCLRSSIHVHQDRDGDLILLPFSPSQSGDIG